MAILPTIDNKSRKRELTEKQQSFLNHLIDTQGDAKIDMQISNEEYEQLGRPGINETVQLELSKIKNE